MKIGFKRLTMVLALLSVVLLAACGKTDTTLKDAVADLTIQYASGDSVTSVTKDLPTLPSKVGEVTITWVSSNTAVVSNAGVVTRPAADTKVKLTATLTFDGKSETKDFEFTVKAVEGPSQAEKDAAKAALEAVYADTIGDLEYEVTENLELVTTVAGNAVTWTTANAELITTAGVVTRPAYSVNGGQTVLLTATINVKGEEVVVEFFAFVKGLDRTVEEILTAAVNLGAAFTSDIATDGITSNQTLQTSVKYEETTYTIVWSSSHPEVMAIDGKVTRPAIGNDDVMVTMTATITHEGVTVTKDVVFKVLSYKPSRVFENINDLYTGDGRAKDGEYVKVKGVKVLGKINDGIFLHDGANILYVFDRSKVIYNTLEVGKVYDVEGEFDIYYSAGQLANYAPNSLTAVESTEVVADLAATPIEYEALIDGLALPTNPSELQVFYEYTRFTAKVIVDTQEGDTSSYKYWLVPEDYADTKVIKTVDSKKAIEYLTKYVSNVYYQSNSEAFAELNGKVVTIDFLMYGFRSDRFVWYGLFFDDVTDIVVEFENDAAAMAAAKAVIETSVPADIVDATTLDLIKSIHGTTVAWTSNNEAVINSTTGVVTPVDGVLTPVELTATISIGTETDVIVKIPVNVGELPVITVKEALETAANGLVRFNATVFATDTRGNYYVSDGTNALTVRVSTSSELNTTLAANIGKEVEFIGSRSDYNGLKQVSPTGVKVLGAGDAIAPVNADALELSAAGLIGLQSALVELKGMSVTSRTTTPSKDATYNTTSIILTQVSSSKTIELRWDDRVVLTTEAKAELDKLVVGEIVEVATVVGWYNNPQLLGLNVLKVVVIPQNDAAKLAADAAAIEDITLSAAGAIELPAVGANGSAIAYAFKDAEGTNNSLIDLTTKTVTMPLEGQVVVVLVATLTLGEEAAVDVEINVTLGTPVSSGFATDLFISEYIEGSSSNKALEIYNGTGATVDLSAYKLAMYNNGKTEQSNILQLTGTLAHGEVIVIVNAGATAAFKVDGAIEHTITYFNGDDAIVLLKNDEIIDLIGVVGVDPGTSWPVGTGATAEFTLVRNAAVTSPNKTFTESEWDVHPVDTATFIGSHTMTPAA
ncbi:MAG: lamin tail domain-containing protein [Acholeplasma sp.]|nr:lamin tail domain-containing protein [Acholeplasma sp.]